MAKPLRPRADHVILVSIDALRPAFYEDDTWPAPTLQQLAGEGAVARSVRSVFPALTYPAHTTLVTGALPARHGVTHNRPFEPGGASGRWHWCADAIDAPTLWEAVAAAGGTCAAVGWPTTVGAALDWNVPDVWSPDRKDESVPEIRAHTTPPGLFEELEREATGALRPDNFALGTLARDDRIGDMAAYLFERHRPTLLLVHLVGTDHLQHENGGTNPKIRRAVAVADRAVGKLLEVAERVGARGRTAVVVTGDHGTTDVHTRLEPNVWLAGAGLLEEDGEWRALFQASGGSAFLRVRDPGDDGAASGVRETIGRIGAGPRGLFRVVEREELDALGADPAAAFALAGEPGVVFGEDRSGPPLRAAAGAGHGHHPDLEVMRTGLVAAGAGVRRRGTVPLLRLTDVAPLVAALLGVDFDAPDGVLLPGLLEGPPG